MDGHNSEPTEAISAWLLSLGSKLYPRNMLGMLNKDLTPFLFEYIKIAQAKERLCWQGASEVQ